MRTAFAPQGIVDREPGLDRLFVHPDHVEVDGDPLAGNEAEALVGNGNEEMQFGHITSPCF